MNAPRALIKEENGRWYIIPLAAHCNGVSFDNRRDAGVVADAINLAFQAGQEDIKSRFRDLLDVPRVEEEEV